MPDAPPAPAVPHPKMRAGQPKRLLALDGGGIRGMITLELLARLEGLLRERMGRGADFRLSDYFDYIGGTSTGAIIATCLSLGMSVEQVIAFYEVNGAAMFDRAGFPRRVFARYRHEKLAQTLRATFDACLPEAERVPGRDGRKQAMTLGTSALKTLLLMVMRNATTDSPWPISNNPMAKFNDRSMNGCNLDLPLWQLVRASTAAPVYFPPEEVVIGGQRFVFVDGGVTMYNNPAFLLFLMGTLQPYRCGWATGEDKMLLVSLGTGAAPKVAHDLTMFKMNVLYNAKNVPDALMFGALNEQDTLCRAFGRCRHGAELDGEIGTLHGADDAGAHLPKLYTYLRYNADLSRSGLDALGLPAISPPDVQRLDSTRYMDQLREVGRASATQIVSGHFDGFVG